MSAAEKLKALDASVPPVPWATTPVTQLKAIRDALPQIVAVVEAAERNRTVWNEAWERHECPDCGKTDGHGEVFEPCLDTTLTALEEALS